MIAMGGFNLPIKNMRTQISSAVNMIVQASRMRDGSRRIVNVSEVLGMEGDVLTMQELFTFELDGEDENGRLIGHHQSSNLRPAFIEQAAYFKRDKELMEAMG